jgi:hypothetical protein
MQLFSNFKSQLVVINLMLENKTIDLQNSLLMSDLFQSSCENPSLVFVFKSSIRCLPSRDPEIFPNRRISHGLLRPCLVMSG